MEKIILNTEKAIEDFFSESNHVVATKLSKAIILNEQGVEVALRCEVGQAIALVDGKVCIISPEASSDEEFVSKKKGNKKR
jgi:hypothetical protein